MSSTEVNDSSERMRHAGEAFAAWLHSSRSGERQDFDRFCAEHSELAKELRALHSAFQLAQTVGNSRSFHQTVREQFGEDAEVTVKLEEVSITPALTGARPRAPLRRAASSSAAALSA